MSSHKRSDPLNDPLSKREAQVLALIVAGRRNKETARDLGISPRTVEAHRASIMAKVGARTLADLVRIAVTVPPKVTSPQAPPASAQDDSIASPGPASSAVNPRSARNPQGQT
jgi:DNA-binding CsgD family transcriptional regulator